MVLQFLFALLVGVRVKGYRTPQDRRALLRILLFASQAIQSCVVDQVDLLIQLVVDVLLQNEFILTLRLLLPLVLEILHEDLQAAVDTNAAAVLLRTAKFSRILRPGPFEACSAPPILWTWALCDSQPHRRRLETG